MEIAGQPSIIDIERQPHAWRDNPVFFMVLIDRYRRRICCQRLANKKRRTEKAPAALPFQKSLCFLADTNTTCPYCTMNFNAGAFERCNQRWGPWSTISQQNLPRCGRITTLCGGPLISDDFIYMTKV